ncbi:TRAP transporter small permease [Maribacter antarcticus]|uniref:TRAP transporter small permease n=1 Tax=Maribacter antarcticus TaxID=505250 RepID=UPI0009FD7359|nr:TRAP transporter small permease [Maribacter antarcticus]
MKVNTSSIEIDIKNLWKYPLELILCLMLSGIVIVTFLQVVFRFFQLPLGWTEELATYLFMWVSGLSVGYAFKTKSHFALRFVVDCFGSKAQRMVSILVSTIMVIFLVLFTWKSIEFTIGASDSTGPGTGLSLSVPYSSSIFAGFIMLYYVIKNWFDETINTQLIRKDIK